nr:zinc finger, CCHC-type, retrotransposon Gag domain protein [Tanacetum cinerariifolium]
MEGKGAGGSKKTPTKNLDAPVTKGELGNEIKRIMSEHLPSILAQSKENLKKEKEGRKAVEEAERRRKAMKDKRATNEQERKRKAEQDRKNAEEEIEDIFEISECSSRQRVKYASHLLKGEARPWWDMIKIAHGDDVASVITWEEFKDLVMKIILLKD